MSLNRVILIGRLTKDPDLRYTPNGIAVCTFTLAVDRPFTNQQGERDTDFIPVVTWRKLAEAIANHLKKGQLAAVEGRIRVRNYEDNNGVRRYVTEVMADNVRFLEYREREGQGQSADSHHDPFAGKGEPIEISEDDLPF